MTAKTILSIGAAAFMLSASAVAAQTSPAHPDSGVSMSGPTRGEMVPEGRSANAPRPFAPTTATGTAQPANQPSRSGVNGP